MNHSLFARYSVVVLLDKKRRDAMPRPQKGDKLIGPYAKPKVRCSGWTYQPGTLEICSGEFISLDSDQWVAWLEQGLAFRVEQIYYLTDKPKSEPYYLSYTVRPERRQRGQLYWYPYKKYHNRRLDGTYLGKTKDVTLVHLDQLALQFLAQINPEVYTQVCRLGAVPIRKVPQPNLTLEVLRR
jgi:hypothetical protein